MTYVGILLLHNPISDYQVSTLDHNILSLPELKVLFNEDELLVVKKGNRLSILPVQNDVAKELLKKI